MSVIETPTAENRKRNSLWTRTRTQNLRRYKPSGTYFIRGRFGSLGIVQESLETDDYEVAKIKPATMQAIVAMSDRDGISQGEVIDQAFGQ